MTVVHNRPFVGRYAEAKVKLGVFVVTSSLVLLARWPLLFFFFFFSRWGFNECDNASHYYLFFQSHFTDGRFSPGAILRSSAATFQKHPPPSLQRDVPLQTCLVHS